MSTWSSKKIILIAVLIGACSIVVLTWVTLRPSTGPLPTASTDLQKQCLQQAAVKRKAALKQATRLTSRAARRLGIHKANAAYAEDRAVCRKQFPTKVIYFELRNPPHSLGSEAIAKTAQRGLNLLIGYKKSSVTRYLR